MEQILAKEAERLSKYIPESTGAGTDTYVITLEIKGKRLTSEALASHIESLGIDGISHLIFIIGGSLGLHNSITSKSKFSSKLLKYDISTPTDAGYSVGADLPLLQNHL